MAADTWPAVWTDGARWFVVPRDHEFAPGDAELRSADGDGVRTDLAALRDREVSREEAEQIMREQVARALDPLRRFGAALLGDAPAQEGARRDDAEMGRYAELLADLGEGVLHGDERQLGSATRQLSELQTRLEGAGIDFEGVDLSSLPALLRSWVEGGRDEASLRAMGAFLAEVAGEEDDGRPLEERVDAAIATLEDIFGQLDAAERERLEAERRARTREAADADIREALRAAGVGPPDFREHLAELRAKRPRP